MLFCKATREYFLWVECNFTLCPESLLEFIWVKTAYNLTNYWVDVRINHQRARIDRKTQTKAVKTWVIELCIKKDYCYSVRYQFVRDFLLMLSKILCWITILRSSALSALSMTCSVTLCEKRWHRCFWVSRWFTRFRLWMLS